MGGGVTRYTAVMSTRSSEDLFCPYMDVQHSEGRSQAHAALIAVIKMFYFYKNYLMEEIKQNLKQSPFFTDESLGILERRRGDNQAVKVHHETRKVIKLI